MRWPCVILVALFATGCRDDVVVKLEQVRDEVCACKTSACAEAAMKKLPASGASTPRTRKLAREVVDCLQRVDAQPAPAPPPSPPP
jgi:hypothetical protein